MLEFIVIDKSGQFNPLKVQQLTWEEHDDGKVRLHFRGVGLDDKYGHKSEAVCSGFADNEDETPYLLCQVIKDVHGDITRYL